MWPCFAAPEPHSQWFRRLPNSFLMIVSSPDSSGRSTRESCGRLRLLSSQHICTCGWATLPEPARPFLLTCSKFQTTSERFPPSTSNRSATCARSFHSAPAPSAQLRSEIQCQIGKVLSKPLLHGIAEAPVHLDSQRMIVKIPHTRLHLSWHCKSFCAKPRVASKKFGTSSWCWGSIANCILSRVAMISEASLRPSVSKSWTKALMISAGFSNVCRFL